jgi:hypothetical protein
VSYTKRQFVTAALKEVIPHAVSGMQPEQLQDALMTMDAMLAEWYRDGIRLSYPLPVDPEDSKLDDRSNVPDGDNSAVINNLALRLCNRFGKAASAELKAMAKAGYDVMAIRAVQPLPIQLAAGMPAGAGNVRSRLFKRNFLPLPVDPIVDAPEPSETFGSGS